MWLRKIFPDKPVLLNIHQQIYYYFEIEKEFGENNCEIIHNTLTGA